MIVYPKQEHMTLGSVESWGSDLGILKDPPKSIMTRRIDKVGDTQDITQMIDDSGDRSSEAILVYARGRNPMVGTEYTNYGTAGGQNRQFSGGNGINNSTLQSLHNGQQAKLPYTIIRDGAFRPPVVRQEDLMPLSRQPRVWTSSFSNPEFPAYVASLSAPSADKIKAINIDKLATCTRPTAQFSIEKPILTEGFIARGVLDNPLRTTAMSNPKGIVQESGQGSTDFSRAVNADPLQAYTRTNKVSGITIEPLAGIDTERYTTERDYYSHNTNISSNTTADGAYLSQQQASVHLNRNAPETYATTQATSTAEIYQDHAWKDLQLESNRPVTAVESNRGGTGNDTAVRGDYHRLAPRTNRGGFKPNDGAISNVRGDLIPTLKANSAAKSAHSMQYSRRL